jgi:hypothetical protein
LYENRHGTESISDAFIRLISGVLSRDFEDKTGINPLKAKGKVFLSTNDNFQIPYIEEIPISELQAGIGIHHYGSKATIKWSSKSGKIIRPSDLEIDETDVEMWFDDLDVAQILRDYASMHRKPDIDVSPYRYEIVFDSFFWEGLYFVVTLETVEALQKENVIHLLDKFVKDWNEKSESRGRSKGLIHNSGCEKITETGFVYYFDMGSASFDALRQLLQTLNNAGCVKKVLLTSYP